MFSNKAALPLSFAALLATAACGGAKEARDANNPSGYKVPRYVSLSSGKVNGRSGPGEDHKILWTYQANGLPVQIVAETEDWRRICDPEGGLSWVKRSFLNGPRHVMRMQDDPLVVHRGPKAASPPVATLGRRALAALDHCDKGWCLVRVGDVKGWVEEREVWGTAPAPQCRGPSGMTRPAG
jgi:SH3-like domain-containing protein